MRNKKPENIEEEVPDVAQDDSALVYALHDPKDLPHWCRALLDPDKPLPANTLYIKRSYLSNIVVLAFTAIPALFALLMTAIDGYHGKLVLKEWLVLFPIFTLPCVWALYVHRRHTRLGAQIASGRLRMGLFLTHSAVLLRMSPHDCSMIPRHWISGFDLALLNVGRSSTPSTYNVRLTYRIDRNGQSREDTLSFACPELEGYFQRHDDLLALLQRWLADGSFASQEHRSAKQSDSAESEKGKGLKTGKRPAQPNAQAMSPVPPKSQEKSSTNVSVALPFSTSMKTNWEHHTETGQNYFCAVMPDGSVTAWENWNNYAPSESGGSVTADEFLAGQYQQLIQDQFGAQVFNEVIAAVRHFKAHPGALKG